MRYSIFSRFLRPIIKCANISITEFECNIDLFSDEAYLSRIELNTLTISILLQANASNYVMIFISYFQVVMIDIVINTLSFLVFASTDRDV